MTAWGLHIASRTNPLGRKWLAVGLMLSSYEDGAAAYNRGDYATARRLWFPLAESGNADAQTMLGIIYEEGHGVSQDYAAAVTWYRRAADQGRPDAQFYPPSSSELVSRGG